MRATDCVAARVRNDGGSKRGVKGGGGAAVAVRPACTNGGATEGIDDAKGGPLRAASARCLVSL